MTRIAFLVSSAREIDLQDSPQHPTGYWAEEALLPYERFVDAGAEVVVMTPDGRAPVADPYGLEPMFHYPAEDRDYFASVYRTFHHDRDDIRITLHHTTELDLAGEVEASSSMPLLPGLCCPTSHDTPTAHLTGSQPG